MNDLIEHLRTHHDHDPTKPRSDLVVVVGVGSGSALEGLRALRPRRLVLVEAQGSLTRGLLPRLRRGSGEWLVEAALVTSDATTATLHQLTHPRESALTPPTGLLEYFPNLRVRDRQQVPSVRLEQILGALGSEQALVQEAAASGVSVWPEAAVLVLEAPGVAAGLLRDAPGMLVRFEWVIVRAGEVTLYEGDADASALREGLSELGFEQVIESSEAIPPFVETLFRRQPMAKTVWLAHERLNLVTSERDGLANDNAELAAARDAQAKLAAERQTQVEALAKEKGDLVAARDALAKEKADLVAARDGLSKEKADLTVSRDALAKEKAELVAARDSQAKLAAERQAQVEALGRERSALQAQLDEARQQLEASGQQQQEQAARQQLMQEELVKAEAQIELIKDLLLRESSI